MRSPLRGDYSDRADAVPEKTKRNSSSVTDGSDSRVERVTHLLHQCARETEQSAFPETDGREETEDGQGSGQLGAKRHGAGQRAARAKRQGAQRRT